MMFRAVLVVVLSAAAGACTTHGTVPASAVSLEAVASTNSPVAPRLLASMSDQRALVQLPASAGAIVAIRSNHVVNGFHQTIAFGRTVAGLKPNGIDLRLRAKSNAQALEGPAVEPPTQSMIREELASQFPRMEMRIVDRPRRNAAGIYGLAIGRWDNGARCVYAWQWIDAPASIEVSSEYDAASLRIRMCGIGVALDSLAALIDDLQLSPVAVETAPPAPVAMQAAIKPRRARAALPIEPPQRSTASVLRHRAWNALALNPPPIALTSVPAAEAPRALLDPTLPAAAFRGPTSAMTTLNPIIGDSYVANTAR